VWHASVVLPAPPGSVKEGDKVMRLSHLTVVLSLSSLSLTACGAPPAQSTAPNADDAGAASIVPSSEDQGPSGTVCNAVTETYALCENLSTCPKVPIDPNAFPDCGYSIHGDPIDPECLCYGYACPMGAPSSCNDMQTLLTSGITEKSVCNQVLAGHCRDLGMDGTPTSCQVCKWNCDGIQSCIWACAC
jgi:hypothetical protein